MADFLTVNGIGLDLELLSRPLKTPPEGPRSFVPGVSELWGPLGVNSAALGPAL